MKNLTLLLFIVFYTLRVSSQSAANDKSYTLTLNGKTFHSGDTIPKKDISNVHTTAIQITDKNNKIYQPVSYECVVDAISISESWILAMRTNPPDKNDGNSKDILTAMDKTVSGDIVFFDKFQFAKTEANLPEHFSFVIR